MMGNRRIKLGMLLVITLVVLGAAAGAWARVPLALGANSRSEIVQSADSGGFAKNPEVVQASAAAEDPLILSYAAKFVCLEPLAPGQVSFSTAAPIVMEKTDVLIHNPNDFSVTFYKKAVRAPLQDALPIAPGDWNKVDLDSDYAVRVDCDDIAKLLTGNATATFIGTYGIGVKVEGFVVIGIGLQTVSGQDKYSPLDVTAQYTKSSEVLKKDISYQPWWRWWWWPLPWRLGYPYQRILTVDPTLNIDCADLLHEALTTDVQREIAEPLAALTVQALDAGRNIDPTSVHSLKGETDPPALVALIGRCDKINTNSASVDYVLLSNKGKTDPDPSVGSPRSRQAIIYPWIIGRWHDLTVVMPQNRSVDLDAYIRQWHSQRWIDAGGDTVAVQDAMAYFFPWWCGWGYWWWWWNGNDCIDIGVGEGESIDVEQITPVRVFVSQWPPVP